MRYPQVALVIIDLLVKMRFLLCVRMTARFPDGFEAGPSGTGNHKVQVLTDSLKEVRDDPLAKELDMQTCYSRSTWHKYVDFVVMSY